MSKIHILNPLPVHHTARGKDLQPVNETECFFPTAIYLKSKNRPGPFRKILLIQVMIRMSG